MRGQPGQHARFHEDIRPKSGSGSQHTTRAVLGTASPTAEQHSAAGADGEGTLFSEVGTVVTPAVLLAV